MARNIVALWYTKTRLFVERPVLLAVIRRA